jgi:hypothetical protein
VELLQDVEHRSVFLIEQPPRDTNLVVGRDTDEALVECAVVNTKRW